MEMTEVKMPDGTVLRFPSDMSQEAMQSAAANWWAQNGQGAVEAPEDTSARGQALSMGFVPIATYEDGEIMENPETKERMFVSPGFVTQNPETIEGMMQGASPADQWRGDVQERIISENPVGARAAVAAQGIPFIGSYTDEMIGAIDPQRGENVRSAVDAMRSQRPRESTALEVGGALASVPAMMAATPAAVGQFVAGGGGLAGRMGRAALIGTGAGAAEGGVSGFGRGEGEARATRAVQDAALGGAAGGVLGAAAPAIEAGVRSVFQNLRGRPVRQVADALGVSDDAANVIRNHIEAGDFASAEQALQRAGGNAMLADAGDGTRALLDASIASSPGARQIAGQAITSRAKAEGQRMTQVLDDVLGAPEGTGALQRDIRQSTERARGEAYRAAYASPIDYSSSRGRTLEGLLTRVPRSAINQANELMRLEGASSGQILAEIAEDGTVSYRTMPSVQQLDYIARALGDVADQQSASGRMGGTTQLGRATSNLQRNIRDVLRAEVPAYGTALDTAADAISRVRAVELGADVLRPSTTRETVAEAMKGVSRAERDAVRAGLRSALDENLARVNAVASDPNTDIREFQRLANTLRSRSTRDKMEAVLGGRQAERLYNELDEAVVSLELRAAVARNSATAERQAVQGAVQDMTAPGVLGTLLSGEPINATKRVVAAMTGNTSEALTLRQQGIYDEIATALTGIRGNQAQQALRIVQRANAGEALTNTQARIVSRALTAPAVMAAYATATAGE